MLLLEVTGYLEDLDNSALPRLLPDILPDIAADNSPVVVVHRSNDDEEMEALSVRQKRARTPSSHSSSRSSSCDKNIKNDGWSVQGPLSKKSASSLSSGQRKIEKGSASSLGSGQRKTGRELTSSLSSGQRKNDKISLSRSSIPKLGQTSKNPPKSK